MAKSTNTNTVRLFGGGGTAQATRPTIDTPSGPIYEGTEQADQYLALKAWVDPLVALSKSFASMSFDKSQVLQDIAAILARLSNADAGVRATLTDLSEAMQGRISNHSGTRFDDPGRAYLTHIEYVHNHAQRCAFGLGCALQFAPRPPRGDETPAPVGQPLGSGERWRN